MNILLVSQPARDGVLRHVIGLTEFLLNQGDRVHLAYSDHNASDQLPTLVDRIHHAGGLSLNLKISNGPQPLDLLATPRLYSFICKITPDVIHAHSSKAGALARGLGLLGLQTPIFYSPHSYYRMHDTTSWKARVFHLLERLFAPVGMTITMSGYESRFAKQVVGVRPSRLLLVNNGVDFDKFSPVSAERRIALRNHFGLPRSAKLIGSVGRFSAQKDPISMYLAFAEAARVSPDIHLVHLGKGELAPKVASLIENHGLSTHCHQIPYLHDPAAFYGALDGFLLTSLYEGMSYAVLEALASNLPLVLTRAPGNTDFDTYGFSHINWCKPGNIPSIATALQKWRKSLDSPLVANHRALASRHFTLESCYGSVRQAYQACNPFTKMICVGESPGSKLTPSNCGQLRRRIE